MLKTLLALVGLGVVLWFGAHAYARQRIAGALESSGMGPERAACIAGRMDKRLNLYQLSKLTAFEEEAKTLAGLRRAARKIGDDEVIAVTTSSIALCSLGIG